MKIEHEEILNLVEKIANYPAQQICKHLVMLDIMEMLEIAGHIDKELIKIISDSDDAKILAKIQELKKSS